MGFDTGLFELQQARRFRQSILLFVILATLPCYCVGAILLGVAPRDDQTQNDQRTSLPPPNIQTLQAVSSNTPPFVLAPTITLIPTANLGTLAPTPFQFVPPTRTAVILPPTAAPTLTLPPAATAAPTSTLPPTATATSALQPNRPPQFDAPPPTDITLGVGNTTTVNLSFSDPDGDPVSFTAVSGDSGVATIPSFGLASFDVVGVNPGAAVITITLQDNRGGTASTGISLTVTAPLAPNNNPVFTVEPLAIDVRQGGNTLVVLQFSDPDGDPVTFTVIPNNPALVSVTVVDEVSFMVNGLAIGETALVITLSDGRGGTTIRNVPVVVAPPP
jgi:hypothetical protein